MRTIQHSQGRAGGSQQHFAPPRSVGAALPGLRCRNLRNKPVRGSRDAAVFAARNKQEVWDGFHTRNSASAHSAGTGHMRGGDVCSLPDDRRASPTYVLHTPLYTHLPTILKLQFLYFIGMETFSTSFISKDFTMVLLNLLLKNTMNHALRSVGEPK